MLLTLGIDRPLDRHTAHGVSTRGCTLESHCFGNLMGDVTGVACMAGDLKAMPVARDSMWCSRWHDGSLRQQCVHWPRGSLGTDEHQWCAPWSEPTTVVAYGCPLTRRVNTLTAIESLNSQYRTSFDIGDLQCIWLAAARAKTNRFGGFPVAMCPERAGSMRRVRLRPQFCVLHRCMHVRGTSTAHGNA